MIQFLILFKSPNLKFRTIPISQIYPICDWNIIKLLFTWISLTLIIRILIYISPLIVKSILTNNSFSSAHETIIEAYIKTCLKQKHEELTMTPQYWSSVVAFSPLEIHQSVRWFARVEAVERKRRFLSTGYRRSPSAMEGLWLARKVSVRRDRVLRKKEELRFRCQWRQNVKDGVKTKRTQGIETELVRFNLTRVRVGKKEETSDMNFILWVLNRYETGNVKGTKRILTFLVVIDCFINFLLLLWDDCLIRLHWKFFDHFKQLFVTKKVKMMYKKTEDCSGTMIVMENWPCKCCLTLSI